MTLTFEKEKSGWYIVLPEWKGSKADLQMVAGADDLLDKLGEGSRSVTVDITKRTISKHPVKDKTNCIGYLTLKDSDEFGANYIYKQGDMMAHDLWLCPVTLFLLQTYPDKIYIKKIKTA